MKNQTIINTIQRWSKYMSVEPPKIVIKTHVKRKIKCLIPIPGRSDYRQDIERMYGNFNPANNKIAIYRDGNKINIVKNQFIRYLVYMKERRDVAIMDWDKIGKMKYDDFLEQEELMIRRLTCSGWNRIWLWFNRVN